MYTIQNVFSIERSPHSGDWRDKTGRKNTASGCGCTADFITLGAHQHVFVSQHQVDDEKKRAVLLCNLTRLQ